MTDRTKKKKYGLWCAVVLVVLVVVIAVVLVIRGIQNNIHEENDNRPAVSIENPVSRDLVVYTQQIGTIMPADYASVVPMMSGEILDVRFDVGDHVKEGDVLVVINSDSLDSLQIAVDGAKIKLDDAELNLERTEALFSAGAVSQTTLEQARSAAEGARLSYDSSVNQLELQKKYSNITAPITGIVESGNAEVHGFASPSSPIAVIAAEGAVRISFGVTDRSAAVIKKGDIVTVSSNGREYAGAITEVSSMIGASGLHEVKALINDRDGLITGSRVPVEVVQDKIDGALSIPMKAVFYSGNEAFVYVLNGSTAEKRSFTPGIYDEEYVAVVDGLDASDSVITTWNKELYNGTEVVLIDK